ncbi:MAG: low specificity L-threonine aldolase [Actinomycetota bacterium]
MADVIDLRSDTVTKPTPEMRRAMLEAEVGDDWYGDDPTVNRLQDRAAEVTGKDTALYVATGTMANEIALSVLVRSGHLVLCEADAHVASVEVSSAAAMSGIAFVGLHAPRGLLTAEMVSAGLQPDPYDVAVVDLVSVENTHNHGGGAVLPVDELRGIRKAAEQAGVPVYLDGARIFNASVAWGTPVREFAEQADALMFSLSKGLGAPIGSVLCGDEEFIRAARRARILFGGAWRQAGIVAAAGLVALDTGVERLHEDHANARRLAEGLADIAAGSVDPFTVETNILYVDAKPFGFDPWELRERLADAGVLTNVLGGLIRLVTHRDVARDDIEETIGRWAAVARDGRGG